MGGGVGVDVLGLRVGFVADGWVGAGLLGFPLGGAFQRPKMWYPVLLFCLFTQPGIEHISLGTVIIIHNSLFHLFELHQRGILQLINLN